MKFFWILMKAKMKSNLIKRMRFVNKKNEKSK